MLWKEVKSWAKTQGYETNREKIKDSDNRYNYFWSKSSDADISGVSVSVSKLAADIYNHMTDNKWAEHQKQYQNNLQIKQAEISDY